MKPFLSFQGSRAGFSATCLQGILALSAFPSTSSGLRFPPYPSREKNRALPPVSSETVSWSGLSGEFHVKTRYPYFSGQLNYGVKTIIDFRFFYAI